ncbi:hypothetical protein FQN54_004061 [Arachnomyces sp. PD_36]|nr:hypothetical protein FQN54_004061 [Arachnomyces sp. PD_36]
MPLFNVRLPIRTRVTLKTGASQEELDKAKEQAKSQGGAIRHEYTLIKGFTVEYPEDHVQTLQTTDHIHVEQDGGVGTQ